MVDMREVILNSVAKRKKEKNDNRVRRPSAVQEIKVAKLFIVLYCIYYTFQHIAILVN
jgi:hypothetical protein